MKFFATLICMKTFIGASRPASLHLEETNQADFEPNELDYPDNTGLRTPFLLDDPMQSNLANSPISIDDDLLNGLDFSDNLVELFDQQFPDRSTDLFDFSDEIIQENNDQAFNEKLNNWPYYGEFENLFTLDIAESQKANGSTGVMPNPHSTVCSNISECYVNQTVSDAAKRHSDSSFKGTKSEDIDDYISRLQYFISENNLNDVIDVQYNGNNELQYFIDANGLGDIDVQSNNSNESQASPPKSNNIYLTSNNDISIPLSLSTVSKTVDLDLSTEPKSPAKTNPISHANITGSSSSTSISDLQSTAATFNLITNPQIENSRQTKRKIEDDNKQSTKQTNDLQANLKELEQNLFKSYVPISLAPASTINSDNKTAFLIKLEQTQAKKLLRSLKPKPNLAISTSIQEANPAKRQATSSENLKNSNSIINLIEDSNEAKPNNPSNIISIKAFPIVGSFQAKSEEEKSLEFNQMQKCVFAHSPLYILLSECMKKILFNRVCIRGILSTYVTRMSDIQVKLSMTEEQRTLTMNQVSQDEYEMVSQPIYYEVIRLGLLVLKALRRNNVASVEDLAESADKELQSVFLANYERFFLYNQASLATCDKFLEMLSSLTGVVNYLSNCTVFNFKAPMPAPPMPEFFTEWNGYSEFHVLPDNKDFLYYWIADWLMYIFSSQAVKSFIRGSNKWYTFDLEPDSITVGLTASLFSLILNNEYTQHANSHPECLLVWKTNISRNFRTPSTRFEPFFAKFAKSIVFIRDSWLSNARKSKNSEAVTIDQLDYFIYKFVEEIYFLTEEALPKTL